MQTNRHTGRHTYTESLGCKSSADTQTFRQTDLPEGQDVYLQIKQWSAMHADRTSGNTVDMQTIAVRADTRTGSLQFALMHTVRADKQHYSQKDETKE